MTIDLDAYLRRIGYAGPREPTAETLAELHWAHLQAVPFENLDIRPLGRRIRLDLPALEDKVVRRRRGGFCYELNGLLSAALRQLGYDVAIVMVQFVDEDGALSPPFDHMALLVRPPGDTVRSLADVGCGRQSPARPPRLGDGTVSEQPETGFTARLVAHGEGWRYEHRDEDGSWRPIYRFAETPRRIEDFTERCRYQDGDPGSHFTQGPICSRAVPGGRVTVADGKLIVTVGPERTETPLETSEAFNAALREHFGIVLERPEEDGS